jgi:tRNA 5-methylaminomethyl-2-thiouridine biosynthesis bifunctional protein
MIADPDPSAHAPPPPSSAERAPSVVSSDSLDWGETGPRSRRFGDVYFSAVDGLAEARAVFLAGCGLPEAWGERPRFVVGELGFGTGLNTLALLELWRTTRPGGGHLSLFSVEAYPLTRDEAARALAAWPELAQLAALLLDAWPSDRRGFHRLDFPTLDATLDLWIGEAADGLAAWSGAANAWFLDGFAPALNPQMWREPLLAQVAQRSNPGARLATFTVAGAVRRGLSAAGFAWEKKPGFGRKRERLEAWLPASPPSPASRPPRVAVIGAGIAGAALTRALRRLGAAPVIIEAQGPAAGASGNPVALVTPRLDAGLGAAADLHAQALSRATELYCRETPDAILTRGAFQLETTPKDASRFDRIADWNGFATGAVQRLSAPAASEQLGEPTHAAGLAFADALVVEPERICLAWLGDAPRISARTDRLERAAAGWRVLDADGGVIVEADVVVLAAGPACAGLSPQDAPPSPMMPVRGQVSWTSNVAFSGAPGSWGSYALGLADGGVLFGATHGREDWGTERRAEDEARNLDQLRQGRPRLAAAVEASRAHTPLMGRASLRAATPDHMPLAGAAVGADGVYLLSGLSARGFTLAPLLAEHVAALILGAPSPLPRAVQALVDPGRYSAPGPAGEPAPRA